MSARKPRRGSRRTRTWERFAGAATSAAITVGVALALATFAFQTAQVWVDEGTHTGTLRWLFPILITAVIILAFAVGYLLYWQTRTRPQYVEDRDDPYQRFVSGTLEYGRLLHAERRDPALLRLRDNLSLTLHVLGFHKERIELGTWALESAQFLDDDLAVMSILLDDLGWANYLIGDRDAAVANIKRAIVRGEQLAAGVGGTQRIFLVAKAYRHLGVIDNERRRAFDAAYFDQARDLLAAAAGSEPQQVRVDLAHVSHAQALAMATMLGVNVSGVIRDGDVKGMSLLGKGRDLIREAREGFRAAGDQGRYAKSLVLEVRILEALRETAEVEQLSPLRDRAVAASVWARPDGAAFITGRKVNG